jgi:hypothetical protein
VSSHAVPPGSRRHRPRASRQRSCDHCLAYGMLTERLCKACRSFASTHPVATCATCGRELPTDAGICRPCRKQASMIAGSDNKAALDLSVAAVTGHQLRLHFGPLAAAKREPPSGPPEAAPPPITRLRPGWAQPLLCDAPRHLSRASAQLPPLDPGLARRALVAAIVDRVTFNACILQTGTQSYRLAASKTAARAQRPGRNLGTGA